MGINNRTELIPQPDKDLREAYKKSMAAQQPADLLVPMFRKEQRHLHLLINAGYGKRVAAFLNMIFIHVAILAVQRVFSLN